MLHERNPTLEKLRTTRNIPNPSRARARYVAQQRQSKQPWHMEDGTVDWNQAPWSEAIRTGIGNLPSDSIATLGDMVDAFKNWQSTSQSMHQFGTESLGRAVDKFAIQPLSRLTGIESWSPVEDTPIFDAVINMYKENYKDESSIKRYVAENPVQFLEDVSTIGAMFYGGATKLGNMARRVGRLTPDQKQLLNFNNFIADESGFANFSRRQKLSDTEPGTVIPNPHGGHMRTSNLDDIQFKTPDEQVRFVDIEEKLLNQDVVSNEDWEFRKKIQNREKSRRFRESRPDRVIDIRRKNYEEKLKNDPEWVAQNKENSITRYQENKDDPEWIENQRRQNRESQRKRRKTIADEKKKTERVRQTRNKAAKRFHEKNKTNPAYIEMKRKSARESMQRRRQKEQGENYVEGRKPGAPRTVLGEPPQNKKIKDMTPEEFSQYNANSQRRYRERQKLGEPRMKRGKRRSRKRTASESLKKSKK